MAGERLTLDPHTEATSNLPLDLHDLDNGLALLEHAYPLTEEVRQWAESADTEGARLGGRRPANRQIRIVVRAAEPTDPAATNLATNPKAALDLTGIAAVGATVTREADIRGLLGVEPPIPSDTAVKTVGAASAHRHTRSVAVTNGTSYTFTEYVYLSALSATAINLRVRNAAGTQKAISSNFTTIGSWTRLQVTVTADATETWTFTVEQNGAGAATFYSLGALIETGSTVTPYFDGDSAGCAWSGTVHASSSTRPASGGDRINAILGDLEAAVARLQRYGGTLRRILPNGDPITFDVLAANIDVPADKGYLARRRGRVTITLDCLPYGRGPSVQLSDHTETTLPALIWTENIPGSAPALGELVIDDDSGVSDYVLWWALQVRHYDAAATAALAYQAEALFAVFAATAVGSTGATGSGSNVMANTNLSTSFVNQFMISQAVGDPDPFTHVGTFRVLARMKCPSSNTGTVSFRLRYVSSGSGGQTDLDPVEFDPALEGNWQMLDLGEVTLGTDPNGDSAWRAEVQAKSTVTGDDFECDYVVLLPVEEGAGQISDEIFAGDSVHVRHDGVWTETVSGVPFRRAPYEGDYLRIPPGQTARFVVVLATPASNAAVDVSARLTITPRYLVVPH